MATPAVGTRLQLSGSHRKELMKPLARLSALLCFVTSIPAGLASCVCKRAVARRAAFRVPARTNREFSATNAAARPCAGRLATPQHRRFDPRTIWPPTCRNVPPNGSPRVIRAFMRKDRRISRRSARPATPWMRAAGPFRRFELSTTLISSIG